MVTLNFDANDYDPIDPTAPIPPGVYMAVIIDSEMKHTRSGVGKYLQLALEVADGDYRGKVLWERLNLVNPNVITKRIANQQFSRICRAVGVLNPKEAEELYFLPLTIHVGIKRRMQTGELFNVILRFEPYGEVLAS